MPDTNGGQAVVVPVGSCRCPGAPHTTDTVSLRAKPDTAMRFAIVQAIREANGDSRLLEGFMASVYLRTAPVGWTLTDEAHAQVNLADLPDALGFERSMAVADKCGDLYTQAIIAPLVQTSSSLPGTTPTAESTSPTPDSPWISSAPSSRSAQVPST